MSEQLTNRNNNIPVTAVDDFIIPVLIKEFNLCNESDKLWYKFINKKLSIDLEYLRNYLRCAKDMILIFYETSIRTENKVHSDAKINRVYLK